MVMVTTGEELELSVGDRRRGRRRRLTEFA
jgi:hypothetical protein